MHTQYSVIVGLTLYNQERSPALLNVSLYPGTARDWGSILAYYFLKQNFVELLTKQQHKLLCQLLWLLNKCSSLHSVDRNYSFLITIQPIPIIQQFDSNQYFLTKIMIIKSLAEYTYRESLLTSFFPSRLSDTEKLYAPRLNGISIQMCCVPLKNCCHFPSCSTVHTTCLTVLKHSELDLKEVILNLFPPLPPLFFL